jgi:hypothetical protein
MFLRNAHGNAIGNIYGNMTHLVFEWLYKINLIIAIDHARHLLPLESTLETSIEKGHFHIEKNNNKNEGIMYNFQRAYLNTNV